VGSEQRKQHDLDELKGDITREFQHMQRLIEEDADMEVDELQQSYEAKLKAEREVSEGRMGGWKGGGRGGGRGQEGDASGPASLRRACVRGCGCVREQATMRLKFENGIKKRTFTSLTKDVEDQVRTIRQDQPHTRTRTHAYAEHIQTWASHSR
jgi:hypothetical protein